MQHQQAERGGLLHVGAGNVELEGGKGVVGTETPPRENLSPCGRIGQSWVGNSGQINPGDLVVLGGGGGGVSVFPQSPSWCRSHGCSTAVSCSSGMSQQPSPRGLGGAQNIQGGTEGARGADPLCPTAALMGR